MDAKDVTEQIKDLAVPAVTAVGGSWAFTLARRWLKNIMNTKESNEIVAQKMNEAAKASIERLEEENQRLAKKLAERDEKFDALEREHDLIIAQVRQLKREMNVDAIEVVTENDTLKQEVRELKERIKRLETELDEKKRMIEELKRKGYNPISSD